MTESTLAKRDAVFIFLCGLIFFTVGLRHQEIIGFESRFYLFALEMWRHGLSWFPTTYQQPYPDYPVTSTVLIYLTAKLFGTLNKWVAVLPSAMAAALTLSATYLIGAIQERRFGWYGVGFLFFTLAFLTEARTISLDMYVAAITTWCFYLAYSRKLQTAKPPWLIISLLLVMSFAIRGPIGIVIPTGVLSIFYLLEKDWKAWFIQSVVSVALLLLGTGILLAIAWHVGGSHFMQNVFRMEIAGRLEVNQTPPFYFYFVENFGAYAVTYPLAILVLLGSLLRNRFLRILTGWVLIIMLGLSIPADKKIRYILSIAPALSLICSYLFITTQQGFLNWLQKSFILLCWILPLLCLGFLSVLYQKQVDVPYVILSIFFVIVQIAMVTAYKKETIFFLAVLSFFVANVFIIEKINLDSNQAETFVHQIENLRQKQHARLAFYREGRDGLAIKYLVNMPREETPLFINKIEDIPKQPVFLVTSEEYFDALSEADKQSAHIITSGKIGHDKVIVFSNKSAARPADGS